MTVALDDLGRRRRRLKAEALAGQALSFRIRRRVRPDGAGELSAPHALERALQATSRSIELEGPDGELQPERGRLGVDSVRASERQRVTWLLGARYDDGQRALELVEQQPPGGLKLEGQRRVEDVRGGQPVVAPA